MMAKRLTVLIPDELYGELSAIKEANETVTTMDLIRAAIRLFVWYRRQRQDGYTVYACKEVGGREIVREIILEGL